MIFNGMGLIVSLIVGAIAGWLAGKIVKGEGHGVMMNIIVGIVGALLASFLFPALGWRMGPETGFFGAIIYSTIGAVILLLLLRLFRRG